jgi:hypothetical protein
MAVAGRGRGLWSLLAGLCVIAGSTGLGRGEVQPVKLNALVGTNGVVSLRTAGAEAARVSAGVRVDGGSQVSQQSAEPLAPIAGDASPVRKAAFRAPGGPEVQVETRVEGGAPGLRFCYRLTPRAALRAPGVSITIELPADAWKGGAWSAGDSAGTFPSTFGDAQLFRGRASRVTLTTASGRRLALSLPAPASVLLVDNRRWFRPVTFTLRLDPAETEPGLWPAGESRETSLLLETETPAEVEFDQPVVIEESQEWIPLTSALDIAPGSALDFEPLGLTDPPAGKHGWLRAAGDHFEFEDAPGEPVRFYGINLVWSSLYLDHNQCDRLADRLAHMGYNSVRVHHYERDLVDPEAADSYTFRPQVLDQLDYFVAAMKKRGLYVSTDLYVSRRVRASEVFPGASGPLRDYKLLIPVSEAAFANWQEFSRRLLTHVNPYTGLAWKDDPAIPLLSMVNEAAFLNFWDRLDERSRPLWQAAFNRWLVKEYGTRAALAEAWGEALGVDEDPAQGTVSLPIVFGNDVKGLALARFSAAIQADTFARMKHFLRDELGCRALLTDMNGWTDIPQNQYPRLGFDYVDAHFYWDHPEFLGPSRRSSSKGWSGGGSATVGAALDLRAKALIRIYQRPFTVSEYNWAGPTKYRAESGLLTGAFAALQDWSGLWRYAYSEDRESTLAPVPMSYFYIASDPIRLATERAAVLLYLRGDAAPAKTRVAVIATAEDLVHSPHTLFLNPELSKLGWVTQLGMWVSGLPDSGPAPDLALPLIPRAASDGSSLLAVDPFADSALIAAAQRLSDQGATEVSKGVFRGETGELELDSTRATFVVNTPRTAGGFSRDPGPLTAGPLTVRLEGWGGAVWISSLDGRPISESRRMLLVHLTDLQNSGTRFADQERLILEDWGHLPYLVRAGTARITLHTERAGGLRVWALDTTGRRVAPVAAAASDGTLSFTADIRGPKGAQLYYELTVAE